MAISVPADFFPTLPPGGTGTLNLKVDVANLPSATTPLRFANRSPTQATALVMDRSATMGSEKVAAMKTATKALVQSLVPVGSTPPSDKLALVTYSADADTLTGSTPVDVTASSLPGIEQAINGIQVGTGASIGDGVFEAQSLLANAFDDLPAASRPDKQAMIVINGALNNQNTVPELYVYGTASPPTGDGNGSWGSRPLTWPARQVAGLPLVDSLQTLAVGAFADLGRLENLSRLTTSGTVSLTIPGESGMTEEELIRKFADTVTASYTNSSRYTRILAGDFDDATLSSVGVPLPGIGAGTKELRVIVVGPGAAAANIVLVGPSGTVLPVAESGDSSAFRVSNPTGNWHLGLTTIEPAGTVYFVEATVVNPVVELLTQVDVADLPLSSTGQAQGMPAVGSPVYIRAIPRDGKPVLGCTVTATVTDPDGLATASMRLLDDGQHQDGGEGDGVYGTTYGTTGTPGPYGVVIDATCVSSGTGAPFHRRKATGITIAPTAPGQDTDSDGMPNAWETTYGLNPNNAADALQDLDGDSLTNVSEFRSATNPRQSDSDGGGESDASELAAGRNPVARDDDKVDRPVVVPQAGNGKVILPASMGLGAGTMVVDRATTEGGPWTRLTGVFQAGTHWAVDTTAVNGVQACYRVRAEGTSSGVTSGWSAPGCVTPRSDPYRPSIALEGLPPCTGEGGLSLRFKIEDPALPTDFGSTIPVDLGVSSSGPAQMRWWIGSGAAPPTAFWGSISNPLAVTLPDPTKGVVSVQVRDGAGNESDVLRVVVPLPLGSCLIANAGPDQLLQCTNGGATVQLDGRSSRDTTGGALTFSWSAPGVALNNPTSSTPTGVFPLGTKTAKVTVSATGGRSASESVQITVVDTTPPVLTPPPDIVISNCTAANIGNAVATDGCGGAVTITNNKPSKFLLGTTVVTYWAVDQFGNAVSATQRVTAVLGDSSSCCPAGTTVRLGTSNNDTINGTSGSDCILGLGGQDTINGLGGNDYIAGGDGNDIIDGGSGVDRVYGGSGQDQLRGGTGNDLVDGGDGDDICLGGDNDDTLQGGQGQDQLFGEAGNDQLFGDDGDDRLEGGDGNDALDGGGLHDICIGGPGTDSFNACEVPTQ